MRGYVLSAQYQAEQSVVPFTLESALYFDRVQKILEWGSLPERDPLVEYPDGVEFRKVYSIGSEYAYAALCRLFPSDWTLEARLRVIERGVFCLAIPLVVLWIGWWTRAWWAGGVAGFFYAVSAASVVRSTGQELSRENSAIPFLAGHLAFDVLADRFRDQAARRRLVLAATAASLALAVCAWDMIRYYTLLWMLWQAWTVLRCAWTGIAPSSVQRERVWLTVAALALSGIFNPYLAAHHFLLSPTMLVGYGLAAWTLLPASRGPGKTGLRRLAPAMVTLFLPLAVVTVANPLASSYGHFSELLWAKIRFLNHKPEDPSLLTWNQRIMWVPALHSANWGLTMNLMPGSFWLTLVSVGVFLVRPGRLESSRLNQLVFLSLISTAAFILFVRFHVYLALFTAGMTGLLAYRLWSGPGFTRACAVLLLAGTGLAEAGQLLRHPERWGRGEVYYAEVNELVDWFRGADSSGPVLANFGVSSSIRAYAGKPIILHPKFEAVSIRDKVKAYGEMLFKSDARRFRDWAEEQGALYYVHSMGELYPRLVPYQMRYFADAVQPPPEAPVWFFEQAEPVSSPFFRYEWGNRKYRVYRVVTRKDEAWASALAAEASEAFRTKDYDRALRQALQALERQPGQETARAIVERIERVQR